MINYFIMTCILWKGQSFKIEKSKLQDFVIQLILNLAFVVNSTIDLNSWNLQFQLNHQVIQEVLKYTLTFNKTTTL